MLVCAVDPWSKASMMNSWSKASRLLDYESKSVMLDYWSKALMLVILTGKKIANKSVRMLMEVHVTMFMWSKYQPN